MSTKRTSRSPVHTTLSIFWLVCLVTTSVAGAPTQFAQAYPDT